MAEDPTMVEKLLELHKKMKLAVSDLFSSEVKFQRALKEAMQDVVNTDATPDTSNVEMLVERPAP